MRKISYKDNWGREDRGDDVECGLYLCVGYDLCFQSVRGLDRDDRIRDDK